MFSYEKGLIWGNDNYRTNAALVNLALVQNASGRAADARALLQRAVGIQPDNAGSHYNLAVVADESGDTAAAVEHYRAFLKYADAHLGVAK